ncbi:penicillin-binding protein 1A [Luteitalea sp. TBR-22]|uniref:transglycosylase domain-containing protein n=1 Tax=Luteitalea sp. TBR-22 TaxID=2802971 RepID=UPI001AF28500|nr:PBP1A family penicillin-binding protein [Luteitalea sp. TBR-22]BCS33744.1 penicillin-binding protein 1A [Luteitalea sp. TBR-22]
MIGRAHRWFAAQPRVVQVVVVMALLTGVVATAWIWKQTWAVHRLTRGVGDTWFHTADGKRWFRLDEQRRDVPLASIAPALQHAFVAVEDHRFYRHIGLDPIGLGRAVYRNTLTGRSEGASTITQQLARTLFLSNRKSYTRKIREAVISLQMELQLTKAQILELYLNRIYLSAGVYGVEPMAQRVFGKSAKDLSLAESAFIAGLARAPAALSPWSNLDGAVARSHVVLGRMREAGFITDAEERAARRQRIRVRPYQPTSTASDAYARAYVRQLFRDSLGGDHPPDWRVDTTIVPSLQEAADRVVREGLGRFGKRDLQAALVAMDPATGDVLALVGGRDPAASPFNRATRSRRQPGSAFKPFVFAAALEQGYSPLSVLDGLDRITPQGPDEWAPENASGEVRPELTLRAALVVSDNRAASLLQQRVGTRRVMRVAGDAGLRDLPNVPSLALGTGLVTPLELTTAFAMFPNGGHSVRPRAILRILDDDRSVAFATPVVRENVIAPEVAFQMVSLLQDVVDRGTAASARRMGVRFPAGGKTGTTDDFKDAWFVGFSSSIVVGVWVGFDQPATIGREAYGSRYALPIWADFMRRAARVRRPEAFERPAGLREETFCRVSYKRPVQGCPVYTEYLKRGDEAPDQRCPIHRGTLRQRIARTIEGWTAELARRLRGLFR